MIIETNEYLQRIVGQKIEKICGLEKHSEEVTIEFSTGMRLTFYHAQDCCESVLIEDFEDDGVTGGVVLSAEEVVSYDRDDGEESDYYSESCTWTFYKIETTNGGLWIRWLGESNGYYSEDVSMIIHNEDEQLTKKINGEYATQA